MRTSYRLPTALHAIQSKTATDVSSQADGLDSFTGCDTKHETSNCFLSMQYKLRMENGDFTALKADMLEQQKVL